MKLRVKAKNCQFDFTVVLVLKLLENINVWLPFEIQGIFKAFMENMYYENMDGFQNFYVPK